MLSGRFAESKSTEIKIDSMSAPTLRLVLEYLYTGRLREDSLTPPQGEDPEGVGGGGEARVMVPRAMPFDDSFIN